MLGASAQAKWAIFKQNWSNGIHTEASKRQKNGIKLDLAFQRINGDNFFHTEMIFELHTNYYGTVPFHFRLHELPIP